MVLRLCMCWLGLVTIWYGMSLMEVIYLLTGLILRFSILEFSWNMIYFCYIKKYFWVVMFETVCIINILELWVWGYIMFSLTVVPFHILLLKRRLLYFLLFSTWFTAGDVGMWMLIHWAIIKINCCRLGSLTASLWRLPHFYTLFCLVYSWTLTAEIFIKKPVMNASILTDLPPNTTQTEVYSITATAIWLVPRSSL
jgi:hypothetical protein